MIWPENPNFTEMWQKPTPYMVLDQAFRDAPSCLRRNRSQATANGWEACSIGRWQQLISKSSGSGNPERKHPQFGDGLKLTTTLLCSVSRQSKRPQKAETSTPRHWSDRTAVGSIYFKYYNLKITFLKEILFLKLRFTFNFNLCTWNIFFYKRQGGNLL